MAGLGISRDTRGSRERERDARGLTWGKKKSIANTKWNVGDNRVNLNQNSSFRKIAKERFIMYFSSFLNSIIEIDR